MATSDICQTSYPSTEPSPGGTTAAAQSEEPLQWRNRGAGCAPCRGGGMRWPEPSAALLAHVALPGPGGASLDGSQRAQRAQSIFSSLGQKGGKAQLLRALGRAEGELKEMI